MAELPWVVLTGGSAGIGLSILRALSADTALLVVSRTAPPVSCGNVVWIQGDLREAGAIAERVKEHCSSEHLPLTGLIHCAASYGADRRHAFLETLDAEWDEVMAVNVTSQFVLTQRLLPLLLVGHKSFIIAISSNVATLPAPGRIAYGCSKAASYALFGGLAAEYVDSPLSVVQVTPDRQVITRGLRRRRPAHFDFSGYIRSEAFQEPVRAIVRARGAGYHGRNLLISG